MSTTGTGTREERASNTTHTARTESVVLGLGLALGLGAGLALVLALLPAHSAAAYPAAHLLFSGLCLDAFRGQRLRYIRERSGLAVQVVLEVVLLALGCRLDAHGVSHAGPVAHAARLDQLEQQQFLGVLVREGCAKGGRINTTTTTCRIASIVCM